MSPGQALVAAGDFLDRHGWCQYAVALTAKKSKVGHDSPRAVRWCAIGALRMVAPDLEVEARELFAARTGRRLQAFNDTEGRTRGEVVAELRRAGGAA